jgi:hypothetical protein
MASTAGLKVVPEDIACKNVSAASSQQLYVNTYHDTVWLNDWQAARVEAAASVLPQPPDTHQDCIARKAHDPREPWQIAQDLLLAPYQQNGIPAANYQKLMTFDAEDLEQTSSKATVASNDEHQGTYIHEGGSHNQLSFTFSRALDPLQGR